MVQPLCRIVWRLLKKLKTELPFDPAIPLLGIYLEKMETLIKKDTCTPIYDHSSLFTTVKTWKQPKCPPTDEWTKKMLHIYNGIVLRHKKKEIVPFAPIWVQL